MKKILFLISLFLLTAINNRLAGTDAPATTLVAIAAHEDYDDTESPLGDGEEKSGEEDKDITEDDDDVNLTHRLLSREKSSRSDLHVLYQETLFKDLEIEVVIPPPEA